MAWYDYYPRYETVAERKRKAQRKLKRMQKQQPDLQPVIIGGKGLAKTWWGKAWNANLESYADFSNRIGRGRSYARNGFVLDLKINQGRIEAQVMGSEPKPYRVVIAINKLTQRKWAVIKTRARDRIDSLRELLEGSFPRELEAIFTAKGAGLFPAPKEIHLSCSCPDWAVMCKHVAAVLYGVGARLDEAPELFFLLRGTNVDDLISTAVNKRKKQLLDSASRKKYTSRMIEGDDDSLAALFAIDMAPTGARPGKTKTAKTKKKTAKKKTKKKLAKKKSAAKTSPKKKAATKKTANKKTGKLTKTAIKTTRKTAKKKTAKKKTAKKSR